MHGKGIIAVMSMSKILSSNVSWSVSGVNLPAIQKQDKATKSTWLSMCLKKRHLVGFQPLQCFTAATIENLLKATLNPPQL